MLSEDGPGVAPLSHVSERKFHSGFRYIPPTNMCCPSLLPDVGALY